MEIGASYMYFVSEGWEMNILKQSFKARIAVTASELDHLMGDQAIRAILIPYESPLSREMVEQICERPGSAKTIYYERGSS